MPLEAGTYIPDLVPSNPAHTDGVGQGDSHLRLIKSALLNTFKNWTDNSGVGGVGYLSATQAQLDGAVGTVVTGTGNNAIFPAGSVATPSIAFTGDPDSGWYKVAEDNIALSLNATQQVNLTTAVAAFTQPITSPNYNNGFFCPVGCIMMWLTNTAPTGWAFLNAQAISRAANPVLFAIFGTTYGAGDGSTTFNLPDWRDMVPIGAGNMGGAADRGLIANSGATAGILSIGSVLGEATHTLNNAEIPTHQHAVFLKDPGHSHSISNLGLNNQFSGGGVSGYIGTGTTNTNTSTTGITIGSVNGVANDNLTATIGGGGAHNNTQLGFVCNFIMKLG